MNRYIFVFLAFVLGACVAVAADMPYDDHADARQDINQALARAVDTHASVIVVFGANWCPDCRELDHAMKDGDCAKLLAKDFQIVKVSVGRFNQNLDIAKEYGVPLEKGIPAVLILSARGEVLYVTREGEVANARSMGDAGLCDFFKRVTAEAKKKE